MLKIKGIFDYGKNVGKFYLEIFRLIRFGVIKF